MVTENGEHGASAMRSIEAGAGSCQRATASELAVRISSMLCTTVSGGRPPSFSDRSIEPRVGWKRTPTAWAAPISAPSRSPPSRGKT
ncbi:Uncharacterised protein [Mycobacteroides abscessus subsp. abscessus]|nr:Uncharacterised protein [Mycobacteroides abscessus subsp. abscessus]